MFCDKRNSRNCLSWTLDGHKTLHKHKTVWKMQHKTSVSSSYWKSWHRINFTEHFMRRKMDLFTDYCQQRLVGRLLGGFVKAAELLLCCALDLERDHTFFINSFWPKCWHKPKVFFVETIFITAIYFKRFDTLYHSSFMCNVSECGKSKVGCKMCTELGPMLTMFGRNPVSMIAVICEMFPNGCCWRLEEWSADWWWAVSEPSRSCTVPRFFANQCLWQRLKGPTFIIFKDKHPIFTSTIQCSV